MYVLKIAAYFPDGFQAGVELVADRLARERDFGRGPIGLNGWSIAA
jgi:hypothetical protein